MEPLYTTPNGQRRFLARIAQARAAYAAVVATNGDAAEAGDNSVWHDNFAYEENQRQMHQLARRVHVLEEAARRLVVVEPRPAPRRVGLGCAVTVRDEATDVETRYVIGGYEDGDPDARRVACNAPLARALLGAEVGDTRALRIERETRVLEVLAIELAAEDEL